MPWVRFTADFDFKPKPAVTIAYRAGMERLVTTGCARLAIERQRAERVRKPKAAGNG